MPESTVSRVASLIEQSVSECQSELVCCFDLLAEAGQAGPQVGPGPLEDCLFAAHRALNQLRLVARRQTEPKLCSLVRNPGKG